MKSHWPISILSSVSSLINMLLPLVLVRVLTPDEIGQFKIFFLYVVVLPAFSFTTGITNGLSYWAGHGQTGRKLIRVSGWLILAAAFLFLLLCLGLRAPLGSWLHWEPRETAIFSVALFTTIASTFFEDSAIALGRIWQGALFSAAWDLARTASILIVGIATRSITAIFLAHTSIQLLKTVVAYALAERTFLKDAQAPATDAVKKVLGYAFPVSLAYVFGVFVTYSDQMLLSSFIPAGQFAFYSIGCLSVPPITILEYSITRVLIPQLSAAFQAKNQDKAAKLYSKAVEELGYLIIPAVTGMVIFAAPIIRMLFTEKFAGAESYLRIYAFSYLALVIPYDSIPRARGQARWIFWNFLSFSVLSLALCYGLLRSFGPYGALSGSLAAKMLMRLYGVLYIRRDTGWRFRDFLPARAASRHLATALSLGALCLVTQSAFATPLRWFLIMGAFFTAAYFALTGLWARAAFRSTMQSPKILMLTQYLGLGGLERMIFNLSENLKSQGRWSPEVLVFEHPADTDPSSHLGPSFDAAGIPVTYFSKAPGFSLKAVAKIASTILKNEVSVVHTHDLGALIYGASAKLACFGRIRLVHTQHSFVHLARKKRYQVYEKFFTRFADEITVVSPDTAQTYRELGIPDRKIHVIPNGVRFAEKKAGDSFSVKRQARAIAIESLALNPIGVAKSDRMRSLAESHWILYMARLHGRKGQDQAMKLWSALAPEVRRKSTLLFVGLETESGQAEKLRQLVDTAPDADRVHYLGPSQTPAIWLQSAEIFLSSSEFEGMPLASIEAAGSGLPLVLSQIPGHQSLAQNARLYDLAHPEQGARAVEALISEIENGPAAFFERSWKEAETIRQAYSVAAMADAYSRLYPWKP